MENKRLIRQLLIWGSTWVLIIFFLSRGWESPELLVTRSLPTLIGVLIIVGINVRLLLPHLYFPKKYWSYAISSFVLLLIILWVLKNDVLMFSKLNEASLQDFVHHRNRFPRLTLMRFIIPLMISYIGSTVIELTHYAHKKEKALITIEKEKLDAEIRFLKSQINPHFLFNTLNNIYTQTMLKSDEAPENVMRLSEMLRYMLYDSNDSKVPLQEEIEYLENYISLVSLKDSRGLNIEANFDKIHPNVMIAPLLFIPFVENAVKHSQIEDLNNGFIKIKLNVNEEVLEFFIENSIPVVSIKKDSVGGVGLVNTQQRLDLLYPGKHEQIVSKTENVYSVLLKLDLS